MPRFFDWKYLLMFAVTAAGVAVPVWLWQSDLQSRSVQFKINSITQVTSLPANGVSGLEVSMNGKRLTTPNLAIIELENAGKRPISTSDFESALELRVQSDTEIVQAQILNKLPDELEPKLTMTSSSLQIQPLLLNPGDRIAVSVLTSGAGPQFSARGRISGVSSIDISDVDKRSLKTNQVALLLFYSFLGVVVAMLNTNLLPGSKLDVHLRGRAGLLVWLVGLGVGTFPMIRVLESYGYGSYWHVMLAIAVICVPAWGFASWLNKSSGLPDSAA